ncbi:MAG: hypothetical protein FJ197_02645 [Gammaproteobacteria bacterium]|nr:hypothetical protein [Gammaproteobacteria bacterium]
MLAVRRIRHARRADLDAIYATRRQRREPAVLVGIGEDPRCECLDIRLPDVGPLPSSAAAAKVEAAIAARQSLQRLAEELRPAGLHHRYERGAVRINLSLWVNGTEPLQ